MTSTPQPSGRWRLGANTSDSPVVIDDDGHQLGGRTATGPTYGPVDTTQAVVTDAIDRGALVLPDEPPRTSKSDASDAVREVTRRNKLESQEA